nr:hypothetical protein [Tanacetum cinerariifolium]
MERDLHTLNDDDDYLLQLDDPVVWQHDNYHRDNKEEEYAHLFAELDQLLEHVAFLNAEIREKKIQILRKRKKEMEDESASVIVPFGMERDLHTLNDDDDYLLQLDDPVVWQHDNYHRDNKEEEYAHLFAELDQLLEHVAFLNAEIRESMVGVDPPVVAVDALLVSIDDQL